MLQIVYYGDPLLRLKAKDVAEIDDNIRDLIKEMLELMDKSHGIGLAAPQVGHSIRLFILRNHIEDMEGNITLTDPQVYINPKVEVIDRAIQEDTEGCLSIPGVRADVKRPLKIRVEAFDENGKTFSEEVHGYKARVILHENDHLNGVFFVDRLDKKERRRIESALAAVKRKYHPNT